MPDSYSDGRTQADLMQWSSELIVRAGLNKPGDFCFVIWGHDFHCALHPSWSRWSTSSSRCRCRPDATVIVNPGDSAERRVDFVRDGQPLRAGWPGAALAAS